MERSRGGCGRAPPVNHALIWKTNLTCRARAVCLGKIWQGTSSPHSYHSSSVHVCVCVCLCVCVCIARIVRKVEFCAVEPPRWSLSPREARKSFGSPRDSSIGIQHRVSLLSFLSSVLSFSRQSTALAIIDICT